MLDNALEDCNPPLVGKASVKVTVLAPGFTFTRFEMAWYHLAAADESATSSIWRKVDPVVRAVSR